MKRGVIGRVEGRLSRLDSFSQTRQDGNAELTDAVDVTRVKRTADGTDLTLGRAATQDVVETESVSLSNGGGVSLSMATEVTTSHTEFLTAGDEFAAVESSDGTFAFELLASRFGASVSRVDIDLDSLWLALEDPTPWKVGFHGHDGPVENGVVHGADVLADGVFGDAIADLEKNQLGARIDDGDDEVKFLVTSSGYLELYSPSDLGTADFATFVTQNVLPHSS